jgi:hypothetical protein
MEEWNTDLLITAPSIKNIKKPILFRNLPKERSFCYEFGLSNSTVLYRNRAAGRYETVLLSIVSNKGVQCQSIRPQMPSCIDNAFPSRRFFIANVCMQTFNPERYLTAVSRSAEIPRDNLFDNSGL